MITNTWNIDKRWSLFLDRDGTINKLLPDDYVKIWEEFEFIPGVLDAIPIFNRIFEYAIIITNQQGVGKKLMTEKALRSIHVNMLEEINNNGGYIDEIYYCTELKTMNSENRKPQTGMGIQAGKDFPKINFKKSIMAGDSSSDMVFGKKLGMKTVLLTRYSRENVKEFENFVDLKTYDLYSFAELLLSQNNL